MGLIRFPAKSRVYIDTQVLIYTVEKHPVYGRLLEPVWSEAGRTISFLTSELSILETLVLPMRQANREQISRYDQFIATALKTLPISRPILREAAALRAANKSLRTPDAIHAATALTSGCTHFLTNDPAFTKLPLLNAIILSKA